MMFGEAQQHQHRIRGIQAAIHSPKTPGHLKPHLRNHLKELTMQGRNPSVGTHFHGAKTGGVGMPKRGQSAPAGNSPTTGAATQMRPSTAGGLAGSMQNAAAQIKQSPMPFQNPNQGATMNTPQVHGPATMGIGNGATKNTASIVGKSMPHKKGSIHPSPGNPFPKKRFHPSGNKNFYGA
jgi:hypothetical protein